jgi:CxxC motif-containing protein
MIRSNWPLPVQQGERMGEEIVICVVCPLGCMTTLKIDEQGEVVKVSGYKCKEGRRYVLEEFHNPIRIFTATVVTENSSRCLLPVRTNRPILKAKLQEAVLSLVPLRASPPIRMGEVLLPNFLNTGANLVASDDLLD